MPLITQFQLNHEPINNTRFDNSKD